MYKFDSLILLLINLVEKLVNHKNILNAYYYIVKYYKNYFDSQDFLFYCC